MDARIESTLTLEEVAEHFERWRRIRRKGIGSHNWSRKEKGRFPEITELKQLVRDQVAPGRDLGHSDRKKRDAG
jgi:predicted Rdx family selenoprotein